MSFDPASTKKRTLDVRERVPRELAPGFREHSRMVDRHLLNIVCSLQKKHGQAYASDAGLRHMVWQDSGMMPGVGTIASALRRLEEQGILAQWWLCGGEILPDGSQCTKGTRLVWWPVGRDCRRRLQARARTRNRREPHRTRLVGFSAKAAVAELERAMTTGSKRETAAQAAAAREAAYLERVETSKRAAAELLAAEIAARGPPEATGT